jgi:hypothetical protein
LLLANLVLILSLFARRKRAVLQTEVGN